MKLVKIINLTHPLPTTIKAKYCNTFWSKFAGYMFKSNIIDNEAIILVENNESVMNTAIHMLFMRFDIAVIWLDHNLRVIDKTEAKKWHLYYAPKAASQYVIESHPSQFNKFQINDQVSFEDN
jgi:uncharacterized membrane protein (UPF0127 family)